MGAKKAPFYRVVVADSRFARDGRFIEEIGYYDPTKEPSVVKIDAEKAKQWLDNGAQPTDTVREILKKADCSVICSLFREGTPHAGTLISRCPRPCRRQGGRAGDC